MGSKFTSEDINDMPATIEDGTYLLQLKTVKDNPKSWTFMTRIADGPLTDKEVLLVIPVSNDPVQERTNKRKVIHMITAFSGERPKSNRQGTEKYITASCVDKLAVMQIWRQRDQYGRPNGYWGFWIDMPASANV